ncbi:MAG: hypothetical protein OXK80_01180 [Bdellovibrionales bacterium]|nr:hypothetical protein [Bdellovibrionales bacterium]
MSYETRASIDRNQELELIFQKILTFMDKVIHTKLGSFLKPKKKIRGQFKIYRFEQKDVTTALFLKIVQATSNLRTGKLLIEHGFLYEWEVIQRLLHEITEDILFLMIAEWSNNLTDIHQKYLNNFYMENINKHGKPAQNRFHHIPRQKIRSTLETMPEISTGKIKKITPQITNLLKIAYKISSGYVHGTASSIMQYYDPEKHHFLTNGASVEDIDKEMKAFWTSANILIMSFLIIGPEWLSKSQLFDLQKIWEQLDQIIQRQHPTPIN